MMQERQAEALLFTVSFFFFGFIQNGKLLRGFKNKGEECGYVQINI